MRAAGARAAARPRAGRCAPRPHTHATPTSGAPAQQGHRKGSSVPRCYAILLRRSLDASLVAVRSVTQGRNVQQHSEAIAHAAQAVPSRGSQTTSEVVRY